MSGADLVLTASEDDLLARVVEEAHARGWLVFHPRPARTRDGRWRTAMMGDKGFPDLVLCRPPHVVVIELKSERGVLDNDQHRWLAALRGCTWLRVGIWRPSDLEKISAVLRGDGEEVGMDGQGG